MPEGASRYQRLRVGVLNGPPGTPEPMSHLRTWLAVERSHHWDRDHLTAWHRERLAAVIDHAYGRVPAYQSRGHAPRMQTIDDLLAVPVLDAAEFRSRPLEERLAGPIPSGTQQFTTSGSTGHTATVMYPPNVRRLLGALMSRTKRYRGIRPGQRWARLTASASIRPTRRKRHMTFSALAPASDSAVGLEDFGPQVLAGYPHLLEEIAEHLSAPLRLAALTTFGEQLDSGARRALREAYGVEPLDTYGANEFGALAWQCSKADLYHLNHELAYLEVLDDRGCPVPDGTSGHVVVTDLANGLLPLLRYPIGDLATMATRPCACGHALPALCAVNGRDLDWLLDSGGARIAPERLWMDLLVPIEEMAQHVARYRVHQSASLAVTVFIVPRGDWDDDFASAVTVAYERVLGPGIPVSVVPATAIERTASGKLPLIRSEAVSHLS